MEAGPSARLIRFEAVPNLCVRKPTGSKYRLFKKVMYM
jgi:hypothetical protein